MNDLKGFHHAYFGLGLLLAGFLLAIRYGGWWSHIFTALGVWVFADDYYQDAIRRKKDPEYQSPLHRFYGKTLYKWSAFVRWINYLADKLFGG